MHTAVIERQTGVKRIMKMHGLKEPHYWAVSILTNYLLFIAIYSVFYTVGRVVFRMHVFTQTSAWIMVLSSHQARGQPGVGNKPDRGGDRVADLHLERAHCEHPRVH